jgi:hypothetical protein
MTLTLNDASLLGLDEAEARFRVAIEMAGIPEPALFLHWCEQILVDHPERKALVLPPATLQRGDLQLDWSAGVFAENNISAILASGDLTIEGRLINLDPEEAPFLLVAGRLSAHEIVKAAAPILVLQSITADRLVFCDSDNGALLVGGDLLTGTLIDCDHEIYVAGDVRAQIISDDMGNMRTHLVSEVFEDPQDPTDEWPDSDLLRARILAGEPILRST